MKFYSNLAVLSGIPFIATHTATAFEIDIPIIRYTEWKDLSNQQKRAAKRLGYALKTWNQPGSASVEGLTWWENTNSDYLDLDGDGVTDETTAIFKNNARKLGFIGEGDLQNAANMWDCWMNHYDYPWDDLVTYGIEPSVVALGWNQTMWESGGALVPESDNKWWDQFTDAEKTAAVAMCYTKNLWNEDKLSSFCMDSPKGLRNSPTGVKNQSCNWVANNMARCALKNGGVSIHCPNTCGSCMENKCVSTKNQFFWKERDDGVRLYKKCPFVDSDAKCKRTGIKLTCPAQCDEKCISMQI
mmetsp:Transcript_19298/g.22981  ORF Transcript_19298/g.22981 Transcript_19298/m.22981 type:complete len:300 (-) Transcript_19298:208-1107(-)